MTIKLLFVVSWLMEVLSFGFGVVETFLVLLFNVELLSLINDTLSFFLDIYHFIVGFLADKIKLLLVVQFDFLLDLFHLIHSIYLNIIIFFASIVLDNLS
jgi:hypothetical protein